VWRKEIGQLLQGRTVGIIGLGRIGREVAKLMVAMGCQVIGHDLAPDAEWADENEVRLVELPEVLAESEILCMHVSASPDAPPIIGGSELTDMRTGALLINMARGGVVEEGALFDALKNGALAGAALDTFVEEPYTGRLTRLENVILTPHLGSYARDAKLAMEIEAVNNLLQALEIPEPI
jgi:D-3-phosphoglycerate dehydrogenase